MLIKGPPFGACEPGAGFKREGDIARPRVIDVQTLFFQLRADPFGEGQRQVFFFHQRIGTPRPFIVAAVTGIEQDSQRLMRVVWRPWQNRQFQEVEIYSGQPPTSIGDGALGGRTEPDHCAVHFGFAASRIKPEHILAIGKADRLTVPQVIGDSQRALDLLQRTPLDRLIGGVATHGRASEDE